MIYHKDIYMRKKIIYSASLAVLFGVSSAMAGGPEILPLEDFFSGFYLGGNVSVHHTDFDLNTSIDLTEPVPAVPPAIQPVLVPGNLLSFDDDGESVDAYGGVQGGFGWTFMHRWYLGIQGFGDFGTAWDTVESESRPVSINIANTIEDELNVENTTTVRLASDYGVAAKLGWVVAPMTMVYGKVGAIWANLKVSNTTSATNDFEVNFPGTTTSAEFVTTDIQARSSSDDETKIGLLLAIGAEQFIYRDFVSFYIEYSYTNYGGIQTGPDNLIASTTATGLVPFGPTPPVTLPVTSTTNVNQVRVDAFTAGLNFYFGRDWF
jgi:opacity protein-like surface antigen